MKFNKFFIMAMMAPIFLSCSDDKMGPTIFPDVDDTPDPNSYTYKFDTWLNQNFRDEYNVTFKYLMEDIDANMNYNLVPATYDNAVDLALLTKHLWYDSYRELCGPNFIRSYGPKVIHLIGSPAYNPQNHSETIGLAEGGVKVSLFKVNEMDITNMDMLNEYYFRTMHHEFAHILHQKKSYPTEFNKLSLGRYDDSSWTSKQPGYVASLGFITPYASSQTREDFAETIANYLTRSDEQMELILWMSKLGWTTKDKSNSAVESKNSNYYSYYYYPDPEDHEKKEYFFNSLEKVSGNLKMGVVGIKGEYLTSVAEVEAYLQSLDGKYDYYPVADEDNVDGYDIIMQKQNLARTWFKDEWKVSMDDLKDIVQEHQKSAMSTLELLRQEVLN